ncbi:hypothetical protein Aduo_011135 [Ancylostoma duodenale]
MIVWVQKWYIVDIFASNQKFVRFHLNYGRLGNQLFHFITGYGIARTLGRRHYIPFLKENDHVSRYLEQMTKVFPRLQETYVIAPANISETVVPFANSCCVYDNPSRLSNNNASYLLLNFIYGQNPRYFDKYLPDVRQILTFSDDYRREGDYIVDLLKITHSNLVCIHIRKTDFDVRNISTDMMSSVEAANTIARKKGLSQFIIFGDDQEFMQNMSRTIVEVGNWEKDAVLVSKFEDYIDLYISSKLCDAFLITAVTSTFGWWLAFFAPGQDAIYYMPDTRIHGDKRPSEELFLKTWKKYKG